MDGREGAWRAPGADGRSPQHSGADGRGQCASATQSTPSSPTRLVEGVRRPGVQRVDVVAQQGGRSGQRVGDAGSDRTLERRQRLMPDACPSERWILVVRVVPWHEVRAWHAARVRIAAGRAADAGYRPSSDRSGHAGERTGTRAAGEPEQHRLGLVVASMPEEYGTGAKARGRLVEGGVARSTGGILRSLTARRRDDGHDLDRIEQQITQ